MNFYYSTGIHRNVKEVLQKDNANGIVPKGNEQGTLCYIHTTRTNLLREVTVRIHR